MSSLCCQGEVDLLSENLKYLVTKEKQLKKKYQQLLIENLQKDVIIRELKSKIDSRKFFSFIGKLSLNCLNDLQRIGNSQKEDSTFIRCAINDLYQKNQLKKKP